MSGRQVKGALLMSASGFHSHRGSFVHEHKMATTGVREASCKHKMAAACCFTCVHMLTSHLHGLVLTRPGSARGLGTLVLMDILNHISQHGVLK